MPGTHEWQEDGCGTALPARQRAMLNQPKLLAGWHQILNVPVKKGASMCVHSMREEAERCRVLAAQSDDPKLAAELEAKACAFEARAVQMEAAKRSLGLIEERS